MKWFLRIAAFLFLLDRSLFYLNSFGVIDIDTWLAIEDELPYDANRAGTNPYRDLPNDPAVLQTIKEGILHVIISFDQSRTCLTEC